MRFMISLHYLHWIFYQDGCVTIFTFSMVIRIPLHFSDRALAVSVSITIYYLHIPKVRQQGNRYFIRMLKHQLKKSASQNKNYVGYYITGLFHRAISQSGTSLNSWAIKKSVGQYTRKLANYLNCPQSNSNELLACLREKPARQVVQFQKEIEVKTWI